MPTWTQDERSALVHGNDGLSDFAIYGGNAIYGIFVDDYLSLQLTAGPVSSSEPKFTCPSASVPGVAKNASISIDGVNYTVTSVNPDSSGFVTLNLTKALT